MVVGQRWISLFLAWCVLTPKFVEASSGSVPQQGAFTILSDTVLHDGWRRLILRKVELPSGLTVDFELVGQRGTDQAVLVFVWNTSTKKATLIREYMPALHKRMLGLAAGMIEDKHSGEVDQSNNDMGLTAGKFELEEECRLKGGLWIRLTGANVAMDKYCTTALTVYLVIDPDPISEEHAKPRDATEEGMEVVHNVTVAQLKGLMYNGEMTVVGSWATLLALDKLREMREIS